MKRNLLSVVFASSLVIGLEAAPTDAVTQADLQALIARISKLEAENQAQAQKIRELEAREAARAGSAASPQAAVAAGAGTAEKSLAQAVPAMDAGTKTNSTGRIYTTDQGYQYYLADVSARIFEPLSESGLKLTPYGYFVLEGVHLTQGGDSDCITDYLRNPHSRGYHNHTSTLSVQDTLLGLRFETPERRNGWTFSGKGEFDLMGSNANDYDFHWRHLYVDAAHESGWSFLFGQTWHLWKIVSPSEIDGAWMENAGHPYRRSPQIRVTRKWNYGEKSSLEARLGIVKNGPGMGGDHDLDGVQDNSASAMPLFEGTLVYDREAPWQSDHRRWLVGLGGMYGEDRIDGWDSATESWRGDEDDYHSMMLLAAASVPIGPFTLMGQFYGGENLGGVQAGAGQRVIFNDHSEGKEVETIGGFIDFSYQIDEDWKAAVGYGFDRPDIDDGYVIGANGLSASIENNDRAYVNLIYRIMNNFRVGIEYARLTTDYADSAEYRGGTGHADRIQFTAFYDF